MNQIRRPNSYLLMFVFLIALDGFHLLLTIQLTADLTPEWSSGSMFHPLSHIYGKTPFCSVETVTNNALNRRRVVVFDRLRANVTPTLNIDKCSNKLVNTPPSDIFDSSTISRNFNPRSLPQPKFFFWDNCRICATWAFNIICVCKIVLKVGIPPLNRCFRRNRVRTTLIMPLLFWKIIFFIKSNVLSIHKIQIFPLFWKFVEVASLRLL